MSEARYTPLSKAAHRARAIVRVTPPIAWLGLMWMATYDERVRPSQSVAFATLGALFLYWIGLRVVRRRQGAIVAARHRETAKLLADGELEAAATTIDATLDVARAAPPVHCILLVQRAQLFLRLGANDRALALLEAVRASKWLEEARLQQAAASLASAFAMTHLVRGEIDDAEKSQREAHAKIKDADRAQLLVLDALLDARRARWGEAAARIDEAGASGDAAPRANDLLRFVRAFVADARGETPRDAGDADVAYLATTWPELKAFAARQQR